MTSVTVDTNVLISFLQNGDDLAQVLGRFDRLVIPFAVDAESAPVLISQHVPSDIICRYWKLFSPIPLWNTHRPTVS